MGLLAPLVLPSDDSADRSDSAFATPTIDFADCSDIAFAAHSDDFAFAAKNM